MAAAVLSLGLCSTVFAYHDGGVAYCEGCHTMHNSLQGAKMTVKAGTVGTGLNSYLLKGTDQSSTCLNCHNQPDTVPSSYHISTDDTKLGAGIPPVELTPGGDFAWLKKTFTWVSRGSTVTDPGERHGHNIVAVDYNYVPDSTQTKAPGGTYPASSLSCISCHDPHGKYRRDNNGLIATTGKPIKASGSYNTSGDPDANFSVGVYRLLGGIGYSPDSLNGLVTFVNDPPAAVAPSTYNRTEATTQTRVAYGKGMSAWCANCHPGMHNSGNTDSTFIHPAGDNAKLGAIANNYNAYVKTGDLTGTSATAYLSLTPFEEGVADQTITSYTQLKGHSMNDDSQLGGPDSNSNVACISCHRAHASGWDSMTRFNVGYEFMTLADSTGTAIYPDPTTDVGAAMGRTQAETQKAYYDRPATKFAAYQRDLCNKCHAKD